MTDCAQLLNDRDEAFCNGQDTSGFDQQLQACNLPRGTWNVDAYGTQGLLVIDALDTDGTVTGSLLGNTFSSATWDSANRLLNFQRPLTGLPDNPQSYIGGLFPYVDRAQGSSNRRLQEHSKSKASQGHLGGLPRQAIPQTVLDRQRNATKRKRKILVAKRRTPWAKKPTLWPQEGEMVGQLICPWRLMINPLHRDERSSVLRSVRTLGDRCSSSQITCRKKTSDSCHRRSLR